MPILGVKKLGGKFLGKVKISSSGLMPFKKKFYDMGSVRKEYQPKLGSYLVRFK
jgi:hypothetical protein